MADQMKDGSMSTDLTAVADQLERQSDTAAWVNTTESDDTLTNSTTATTRNRSTAFLDGLRGVACLMVYMSHHIPSFYGFEQEPNSLESGFSNGGRHLVQLPFIRILFTGGSAAVAIFFVLSGYVLSKSPLGILREGPGQVKKCYTALLSATVRRPFRLLLPPAALSLMFAALMQMPFGLAPRMTWPDAEANVFLELVRWVVEFARIVNPFAPHGIAERWFVYNPPLWTIGIEFRGSLLLFLLVAAYARFSVWDRFLLFVLTGLVLLFTYQWSMALFMAGIVLAINDQEGYDGILYRRLSAQGRVIVPWLIFIVGWYLVSEPAAKSDPGLSASTWGWFYMTRLIPANYKKWEYWRWWHSWGAVFMVYGVLRIKLLQDLFTTKHLRFLGRVSFSLYLIHIPFLFAFCDRIYRVFGHKTFDFETGFDNLFVIPDIGPRGFSTRFLVSQMFILPLNLLVAHLSTVYLDGPSVKVGRWISDRLVPRRAAPSEQAFGMKEAVRA